MDQRGLRLLLELCKPYFLVTLFQLCLAILMSLTQLLTSKGISALTLIVYESIIATLVLSSLAFFLEKGRRPPLSFKRLCYGFLLGLLQVTLCQILLTVSLQLVGSTFESIVLNLQTAIIFVLALIFGQEQVRFQNFNGQAKIFGVAISVGGALTMVIWKGPAITESTLLSSSQASTGRTTVGSILVIVAVLSTCFWNILVGIMVIGLSFYAMIWCIHKRGPVLTSAFNPLLIIFSFLLKTFVYKNPAHWGSIVGAVLIVSGLYLLLWAKARDAETEEVKEDEPISSPLIQS